MTSTVGHLNWLSTHWVNCVIGAFLVHDESVSAGTVESHLCLPFEQGGALPLFELTSHRQGLLEEAQALVFVSTSRGFVTNVNLATRKEKLWPIR